MRTATGALIALLNGNTEFLMADLFTITMLSGDVLRWTSLDMPLTVGGSIYTPYGTGGVPIVTRGGWECATGLVVDTLDMTLQGCDVATIDGVPVITQAHNGAFDGASVKVERAFMAKWGDVSAGTVELFQGSVASIDASSTTVQLKVNSVIDSLNIMMPRNLFLPNCTRLLYDAGCTMIKANFTVSATVASGATITVLRAAASTGKPAGYFETGVLAMTSGAAAGARRGVSTFDGTTFILSTPLPAIPVAGDTFIAIAGCDRTVPTCTSRFNNKVNFRGFKDIPVAETSV